MNCKSNVFYIFMEKENKIKNTFIPLQRDTYDNRMSDFFPVNDAFAVRKGDL